MIQFVSAVTLKRKLSWFPLMKYHPYLFKARLLTRHKRPLS